MKKLKSSLPMMVSLILLVSAQAMAASIKTPVMTEDPLVKAKAAKVELIDTVVSEPAAAKKRDEKREQPIPASVVRADFDITDSSNVLAGSQLIPEPVVPGRTLELTVMSMDEPLVSLWLEERSIKESAINAVAKESPAARALSDLELSFGGGWCNYCGCWLAHGYDPHGTPQQQIGHPFVCVGGANSANCWSHQYTYCVSTG